MNIRTICLGMTLCLSISGGAAVAGALDVIDPINQLHPLYTGSIGKARQTSPVMRSRFRAALATLPDATRRAMMRECQDEGMTKPYAEFCADLHALGGANH